MQSKIRFKILVISCLAIGLTVPFVLSYLSNSLFTRINTLDETIKENNLIRKNTLVILYELVLAESAERGYCISGNKEFLSHYNQSKERILDVLQAEKKLLNKIGEHEFAVEIHVLVHEKINFTSDVIKIYNEKGPAESHAIISTGKGKYITDSLIKVSDRLSELLQRKNNALAENFDTLKKRNNQIDSLGTITAITVFFLAAFFIFRNIKTRDDYEKSILETKKKLRENEKKFMQLFYNNPACSVYVDMETSVVMDVNQAYLNFIGYKREEIINNPDITRLIKIRSNEIQRLSDEIKTQGFCNNIEMQLTVKSGDVKTIILFASVIQGFDDRMGVIHHIIDVTENRKFASEMIKAKHEAEAAAEAKEQFLANMSHEIRTPLNAILGFSNLLDKTPLNQKQETYAKAIKTSSANLLNITNDILDYSKLESGMFRIEKIGFDLKSLINSVYTMFTEKASEKKLAYTYHIDETIPSYLLGDPTRLTQVLVNLLGNAFKFTAEGSVQLQVKLLNTSEGRAKIGFEISDTGIGINKEDLEKIFERFNQAETKITRQYGGSGLGLAIVKRLIELQQGSIDVVSEKNGGSRFSVAIEYEIQSKQAEVSYDNKQDNEPLNLFDRKILLVEDNHLNQLLAGELMKSYGLDYTVAENGEIAIEILKNQDFDLILMDLQMPVMDGFKATEYIRNKLHMNIPIVAMSAHVLVAEKEKCLRSGMNDFVTKPFKEEEFKSVLRKYLPEVPAEDKNTATEKNVTEPGSVDLSSLLKICNGNTDFVKQMIELFLTDVPTDIEKLHGAVETVNYERIKAVSHKLKSSVGIIGMRPESLEILKKMEHSASEAKGIEWMPESLKEFDDYFFSAKEFLVAYEKNI